MRTTNIIICFLLLAFSLSSCVLKTSDELKKNEIWDKLKVYFSPPMEYRNVYGNYRSPLLFANGKKVESARDWQKRRAEILSNWTKKMGEWPPLLEKSELEFLDSIKRENFKQFKIRLRWMPNENTEGYLLIPENKEKMPAVITVYYESETSIGYGNKPFRDYAYQLAKRGFVTLSLGTAKATQAKIYSLFYPSVENATIAPLSTLAYAAANAWYALAKIEKVDTARIGIMGHSFGGKWAMFASCLFDKFTCAVWSDPGIVFDESRESVNYWEPYYLGYQTPPWRKRGVITEENPATGLYVELRKEGYDLHELHALMAPRPFLVSGGSEDPIERWVPLNHTIAVNKVLGYKDRVGMTNRPTHSGTLESNEQIYLFFEYFLK